MTMREYYVYDANDEWWAAADDEAGALHYLAQEPLGYIEYREVGPWVRLNINKKEEA